MCGASSSVRCWIARRHNKDQSYTLEEVVLRVVGDLGVPVAYGLRSGHVSRRNITLPFGVRAALHVDGQRSQASNSGSSHGRRLCPHGLRDEDKQKLPQRALGMQRVRMK